VDNIIIAPLGNCIPNGAPRGGALCSGGILTENVTVNHFKEKDYQPYYSSSVEEQTMQKNSTECRDKKSERMEGVIRKEVGGEDNWARKKTA